MGHSHEDIDRFWKLAGRRARTVMHSFDATLITTTAWAYIIRGVDDPKVFHALARQAIAIIDTFDANAVSVMACAFAEFLIADDELILHLSAWVISNIHTFQASELVATAWAFAKWNPSTDELHRRNRKLFDQVSRHALSIMHTFSAHNVVHLALAFATMRIANSNLFLRLYDHATGIVGETFDLKDVLPTIWASYSPSKSLVMPYSSRGRVNPLVQLRTTYSDLFFPHSSQASCRSGTFAAGA